MKFSLPQRAARGQSEAVRPVSSIQLNLVEEEIHVWHAALDLEEEVLPTLESTLSPEEKARADRFHFQSDRNRFVAARGLLRKLLGGYLQQPPSSLEFSHAPHGKPCLSGENGSSGLCFNLSHSSSLAVYAFARKRTLGIDVEQIRADSAGEEIAKRYFSVREVSDLQTLAPEERVESFFQCWTRKEAYLKATGMGLQIPLDSFSVSLLPGEPAQFLAGVEPRWHLQAFRPAEGYVAAIVYDGGPCSIQCFSANHQ